MPTIIKAEQVLFDWLSKNYPMITQRYSMTSMMGIRKDLMIKHPELKTNLSQLRMVYLAHLANQCHYNEDEVSIRGFEVFINERNKVEFFDDALPALKKLSNYYPLASISNGNADVYQTSAKPYFKYAINAADINSAKPEKALFDEITRQAQTTPSDCLYIGDDFNIDILGAHSSGWHSIWLNRENKTTSSNKRPQLNTIKTLSELTQNLV